MDQRPIGLLDSGIGGLTVVKEVMRQLPKEATVFIGDNANLPYGDKTTAEIIALTRKSVHFLLTKNVKLIIFACNTATATALAPLQAECAVPLIGVINSGSQAALAATKKRQIGVVATSATVKSHAYRQKLLKLAPDLQVSEFAAPQLVPLIEQGAARSRCLAAIREVLPPLQQQNFDTLVLGCTHYPIISAEFVKAVAPQTVLINPAVQTVMAAKRYLQKENLLNTNKKATHEFYTTGDLAAFRQLGQQIMQELSFSPQQVKESE